MTTSRRTRSDTGGQALSGVALERERWSDAWRSLGVLEPRGLLDELAARYAEPHRAYHTLQHLHECFEALAPAAELAEHLAEVQLALWFHDAIYDTRAQDNEERSARWAADSVARAGARDGVAARVHALVMVTKHAAVPAGRDAQLLVDVDLSILGASAERFAEYEQQVRREYAWVPETGFRQARARVLGSFLARPRIYTTSWFEGRLEARARENLARSIAELSG